MGKIDISHGSASKEMLLIVLANIIIFGVACAALMANYIVSLCILLVIVVCLLILDKKGIIGRVFSLYIRHKKVAFISVIVLMILMPFVLNSNAYVLHIAVLACLYCIVALGLNFQMGSTDMTNFAAAAFFGVGAYATGVISVKWGMSPWLGIPFAAMCALILGFVVGAPTLRTKGYYLSLVTMALQLVFTLALMNIDYLGGPNGIAGLSAYNLFGFKFGMAHEIGGFKLLYQANFLYLAMFILIIATYVAMRVNISRQGLALNNIAQDETAANCFGINITRQKLFAFCLGAVFCGVAGAVYGQYMMFVGPDDFDFNKSLIFICMVILGGMDNPVGVLVGAFILTIVNEKLRDFADYQMLFYGIILMTVLIARPKGLINSRVRNYCENYKLKITKKNYDDDNATSVVEVDAAPVAPSPSK